MLTNDRVLLIRSIANNVPVIAGIGKKYPLDLDKILKNFDINLYEVNMDTYYPNKNISGILSIEDNKKEIYINSAHIETRNKFTVAHELGHLFLHAEPNKEYFANRNGINKDHSDEEEADFFAANILMPDELVEDFYFTLEYPILSILANKFKVSKAAMKRKLNYMGLNYFSD